MGGSVGRLEGGEQGGQVGGQRARERHALSGRRMLERQLGKTPFVAGDAFSYGDIPVGIMCYRFVQLVPERPVLKLVPANRSVDILLTCHRPILMRRDYRRLLTCHRA